MAPGPTAIWILPPLLLPPVESFSRGKLQLHGRSYTWTRPSFVAFRILCHQDMDVLVLHLCVWLSTDASEYSSCLPDMQQINPKSRQMSSVMLCILQRVVIKKSEQSNNTPTQSWEKSHLLWTASLKWCYGKTQRKVVTVSFKKCSRLGPTCYGLHRSKSAQEKVKAKW